MPFDVQRFVSLRERAVFNGEYWRGTMADLSPSQYTMSITGAPSWSQVNGLPVIQCPNATGPRTPAAVNAVVNATASFSIEYFGKATLGVARLIYQMLNGGIELDAFTYATNGYVQIVGYTAAGAAGRTCYISLPAIPAVSGNKLFHVVGTVTGGFASALGWVNGVPSGTSFAGAGVVASSNPALLYLLASSGACTSISSTVAVRIYPFALTNEDAAALYGAAKSLVGEI
jgi:hypothetical protein